MAKAKTTISKVRDRKDYVELKSLGIEGYDQDNLYPQRTIDIANDSGTTKSCLKLLKKYWSGSGFNDPNLGKLKLNRKGLTVDGLRKKLAATLPHHNGAMIHFNYNGFGQKTEIHFVPFEFGRLTLDESDYPDRIAVYDNWDAKRGKFKKEKIKYICKYDPLKVLEQVEAEQVKTKSENNIETLKAKFDQYKGQIWYWTPDGQNKYPLCTFDSVLEDCITEAQTKRFKSSTSSRNFMPSHYVVTGGSEVELDEDGKPVETEGGGIAEVLGSFQGGEEAGQIALIEKDHDEETFEIHKVEIQNFDRLQEHTENSATEDIVRNLNIPDILLLRREGGLGGNGAELYEARTYLNETTQEGRDTISEIIEECLKGFVGNTGFNDYTIEPLKHKKPIDKDSFQYYSKNEIRKDQGHDEIEDAEGDTQILAVTLGVGGTQSLVGIVSNPDLSLDEKKGTIKVLFGLTDEDTNLMLGI